LKFFFIDLTHKQPKAKIIFQKIIGLESIDKNSLSM